MPSVQPGSLVVITGVNGHLASATAIRLLQKGYKVRGTVRALKSGNYVRREFASFGSNFELVEVRDITITGAFDKALEGAFAVVHLASPVTMDAKRPEEQYVPAVDGTVKLMESMVKHPGIQKFLYFGSIGSVIMTAKDPAKDVITGDDWNVMTGELVKNLDDPMIGFHIYVGSKLVAEKAAWKFMEDKQPRFTMTALLPSVNWGPIHKAMTGPPRQDVSLGWLYDLIGDPPRKKGVSTAKISTFVHVYDVADIVVAALTSPEADGQRIICNGERTSYAVVCEILRKAYPDRRVPPADPNEPALAYPGADVIQFDTSLGAKLLGGRWRSLEEMTLDGAKALIEKEQRGWDKED
ncbi:Aldehyde reductase 2 [Leucoagaricus sp. SymC.cos]|nr:Aldehyde reductase 2 [Leucoagaricus sp. SymC.cos]